MSPINLQRAGYWEKLFVEIDQQRQALIVEAEECAYELRLRLIELTRRKHCSSNAPHWIVSQRNEKSRLLDTPCTKVSFSHRADGRLESHPALKIQKLQALDDGALLTIAINIDKTNHLIGYNIGLQGIGRNSSRRWYARIDLHEASPDSRPKVTGGGFCNHPLLHCQFGMDPNDRSEQPAARAPVPWLPPWHAMEWLLATTHPDLEPERFY